MTNDCRARLAARLRANGLVPPGITVRFVRISEGSRSGGWKWRAQDGVSGADLGLGSRIAVSDLYLRPAWELRREETGLHIGLRDSQSAPGTG